METSSTTEMGFFERVWNNIYSFITGNFQRIILFIAVLIVGLIVIKLATSLFRKAMNKSKLHGTAGNFLTTLVKTALIALYVIILLSMLGVDTTSLVAIFSVLTLAISLAVQGVISNLASGIMLVVTKPFEEGDFVDIGGTSGIVQKINITCTKLKTGDNKVITIPNSSVTAAIVTNYSANETRRLDLTFSVAYGSNVEQVKALILGVIAKHEEILKDPAPMVRLTEHGASSLDFVTRVWVLQADYWNVNFDLKEEVLAELEANNISIPFPQMDVHVVQ